MRLPVFSVVGVLSLGLSLPGQADIAAKPYAHYDAAETGSITLGAPSNFVPSPYTQAVTGWSDQSGNGFDATAPFLGGGGGQRGMVYPGPLGHTFTGGAVGIETGDTSGDGTALSLLDAGAPQDNLLDFTAGATSNSGFSVYLVFHNDANGGSYNPDFNYLLGNCDFPNNAGPGIWLNATGFVWADIDGGGQVFAGSIAPGEESIISFNYNAASGDWRIANLNGRGEGSGSGTGNDAAGNFSSADFLGLGGSVDWGNLRADGDFGEVLLYDRFIDPTSQEHADTLAALKDKWLIAPEPEGKTETTLNNPEKNEPGGS